MKEFSKPLEWLSTERKNALWIMVGWSCICAEVRRDYKKRTCMLRGRVCWRFQRAWTKHSKKISLLRFLRSWGLRSRRTYSFDPCSKIWSLEGHAQRVFVGGLSSERFYYTDTSQSFIQIPHLSFCLILLLLPSSITSLHFLKRIFKLRSTAPAHGRLVKSSYQLEQMWRLAPN